VKVEGQPDEDLVEPALLAAYPELLVNRENGNLCLVIELVSDLARKLKI
jgi:hypothetical protein